MTSGRTTAARIALAVVAVLTGAIVLPVAGATTAAADTAPTTPNDPVTYSTDALPTVQIDGVAWAQLVVGSTVYVTGQFSSARPAGAGPGSNETPRSNILAYDLGTGRLLAGWAPTLNAQGRALAASADGSRIYVAGDFTGVSGVAKNRIVALDAATGAVVPGFAASANSTVDTLAVMGSTLYAGGLFTSATGVDRSRLAAFDTTTGTLTSWAPTADRQVLGMVALPASGKVVVGGRFTTLDGAANYGLGALDGTTGGVLSWPMNSVVRNAGDNAAIYNLSTDGSQVYATGYTFGSGGNFESAAASDTSGNLVWVSGCLGDTYGSYPSGGALYTISHAHNCSQIGGHPETSPRTWHRALAFSTAPAGTVLSGTFAGRAAPRELTWFPTLDGGTYTGQDQAAWTVTGNARYLVMAGEFPRVNGVAQQGLVRMAIRELAPDKEGPQEVATLTPTATSPAGGTVDLSWPAGWDHDNGRLTYEVLRGDPPASATVVARTAATSTFWTRPTVTATDRTAPGGTVQTYRIRARDAYGNTALSAAATVAVTAGDPPSAAYSSAVAGSGATNHWRLGEATGTAAADQLGGTPLTLASNVTRNVAGALSGDTDPASRFPGSGSVPGTTTAPRAAPSTLTEEVWFRTTTTSGGKLVGFGTSSTGSSSTADRHLYMADDGRLYFGVLSSAGARSTVNGTAAYNDGAWHQAAASFSPAGGARLYVDGALVASSAAMNTSQAYSGYWRVGGDSLGSALAAWPARPSSTAFAGTLDEVAVYGTELTAAAVAQHYAVGRGQVANRPPAARASYTAAFRTVSFDASASSDPDGSIASYDWDFGDGTTGTGATPSHTYAGTGSFGVTLRVTDDGGATASTSLVAYPTTPQNASPTASFSSSVTNLGASFDAAASSDPDGSIASYAWDFGDGSTGTGAAPSHAYARAGTYPVTLTVTDDAGATARAVSTVTVTAAGGTGTVVAADEFGRTVAAGLGSAEVGGSWTPSSTATTSVDGSTARFSVAAGKTVSARLGGVSAQDTDLTTLAWTDAMPTGGGVYLTAIARSTAAGDYRARVKVDAAGAVSAGVYRSNGTAETAVGPNGTVSGLAYAVGTRLRIRVQAGGAAPTTLRMKVWADGTAEPAAWLREVTDSTDGYQGPGAVGVLGYSTSTATATTVERFDSLRATAGTAAVNALPAAAFTSGTADLKASFDGSGSSDPDGTIASYAWDFGDGSGGSGAAPSHAYAASGTYPVRLTVTDNSGGTASVGHDVTVTSATPPQALATDAFGRSVTAGWGSADTGGPWTTTGTGVTWAVDGAAGSATAAAGKRGQAVLGGVSAADADVSSVFSLDAMPTGTGAYVSTNVRSTSGGDYRVRVRITPAGAVAVGAFQAVGGTETALNTQATVSGLTYAPGLKLHVRSQVVGTAPTTIRYRLWVDGATQPTTWTELTDATAGMQAAGAVGFNVYSTSSATAPLVVRFDDLDAVRP